MTNRTFASWVAPIAARLASDRSDVRAFVRSAPPAFWGEPSVVEGWTNKHILAHLAGGNDQLVQEIIERVIARRPLPATLLDVDTDAENATRISERLGWPVERLVSEIASEGERAQDLLSRLSEDDRAYREGGFPMTLENFLRIVHEERHDLIHLEQLRADARP
jgi:hypothetical protein